MRREAVDVERGAIEVIAPGAQISVDPNGGTEFLRLTEAEIQTLLDGGAILFSYENGVGMSGELIIRRASFPLVENEEDQWGNPIFK